MSFAVAWVESPLQCLNALEAQQPGEFLYLYVRCTTAEMRRAVLAWQRLASSGHLPQVEIIDFAHRPPASLKGHVNLADRLLLGDPCSGQLQAWFMRTWPLPQRFQQRLILLDDGLATLHTIRCLSSRSLIPLRRLRQPLPVHRKGLALLMARRLRTSLAHGEVVWGTGMTVPPAVRQHFEAAGGHIHKHDFSRAKQLSTGDFPTSKTIVIGSSLAADGLIDFEAYIGWLRGITATHHSAYFPHRRETPEQLATISAIEGITVLNHELPIEITLAQAPAETEVFSLPTSALAGLVQTMVRPQLHLTTIPASWWKHDAPEAFRRELNRACTQTLPSAGHSDTPTSSGTTIHSGTPGHTEQPRIVAICDSESYLKWAVRTLAALSDTFQTEMWLIRTPIMPTAEQIKHAVYASPWENTDIPIIHRSELSQELTALSPEVVLAAATGPVVRQIFITAARLDKRPGLVSGLPGIGLPARPKGMQYRRLGDIFITHSHYEERCYRMVANRLDMDIEMVVTRLPMLHTPGLPQLSASQPRKLQQLVFAAQAKVPPEREQRMFILHELAAYKRTHPDTDVIIKVRSRPGEQETHYEAYSYLTLLAEAEQAGDISPGEITIGYGPMTDFLTPGTGLVTVSSTAALEAIDAGLPTHIITDFGLDEDMLNAVFAGSGITGSLSEMRTSGLRFPTTRWLADNYFHPPDEQLLRSLQLLALRSQERQLPPRRSEVWEQRLRVVRAEVRTWAPDPVVTAYQWLRRKTNDIRG